MSAVATRRVIVGESPPVPGGIAMLAHRFRYLCRQLGYHAWVELSRTAESTSRYVRVETGAARWPLKIRISDHELARPTGCDFELVSRDGRSGAEHLSAFIYAVARGVA